MAVEDEQAIRPLRCAASPRHHALRTTGDRQDAPREGRGHGSRGELHLRSRARIPEQVGRRIRADGPRDVPQGQDRGPLHHLLRRDRRDHAGARRERGLSGHRAGDLADPHGDGRPRGTPQRDRDRGDEPDDLVDTALLRPGRFDRHIYIAPPDLATRKAILEIHTRKKPIAKDVDLDDIARRTDKYTGAELAAVANEASMLAIREYALKFPKLDESSLKKVSIEKRHFDAAMKRIQPQTGDPSLYTRMPTRVPRGPEVS